VQALTVVEGLDVVEQAGAGLVLRWVALNALYGAWDEHAGMPIKDRIALDRFTSEACRVDREDRILTALRELTQEAKSLLESAFLIERFWRDAEWDHVRPQRGRAAAFRDDVMGRRPASALHRLLIAVYFLRCQIVHGGATLGSQLNRVTARPASTVLRLLSSRRLVSARSGTTSSSGRTLTMETGCTHT
jgi:hypothetical protein